VDVRILSATHKDLAHEVEQGNFRQDLYYRLNVIQVDVPPLRERMPDLLLLAEHFLQKLAAQWDAPALQLTPEALTQLMGYRFPGNVRELENILERAATLSEGETIQPEDLRLPQTSTAPQPTQETRAEEPEATATEGQLEDYLSNKEKEVIMRALEQTRWNKTAAAKLLGISFRQLRYRLKKLGVE
jgi:two-component system response regulator PilR (NtrC family)